MRFLRVNSSGRLQLTRDALDCEEQVLCCVAEKSRRLAQQHSPGSILSPVPCSPHRHQTPQRRFPTSSSPPCRAREIPRDRGGATATPARHLHPPPPSSSLVAMPIGTGGCQYAVAYPVSFYTNPTHSWYGHQAVEVSGQCLSLQTRPFVKRAAAASDGGFKKCSSHLDLIRDIEGSLPLYTAHHGLQNHFS